MMKGDGAVIIDALRWQIGRAWAMGKGKGPESPGARLPRKCVSVRTWLSGSSPTATIGIGISVQQDDALALADGDDIDQGRQAQSAFAATRRVPRVRS